MQTHKFNMGVPVDSLHSLKIQQGSAAAVHKSCRTRRDFLHARAPCSQQPVPDVSNCIHPFAPERCTILPCWCVPGLPRRLRRGRNKRAQFFSLMDLLSGNKLGSLFNLFGCPLDLFSCNLRDPFLPFLFSHLQPAASFPPPTNPLPPPARFFLPRNIHAGTDDRGNSSRVAFFLWRSSHHTR